ncbi:hypothetical protein RIF29_15577 [Crotalaria pallida]|uniref:Uncharacterized protein n=1 Tax=Crotalaria pallida TaxID=3830 RepID=A0AAN9FJB9_CROPI
MPIIFSTSSLALPGTLAHFTGLSALKNAAVALNPRGNEDVKIVILSAIASWEVRSPEIIQESLLSFFGSGLNEKETLRLLRAKRTGCLNHLRIYVVLVQRVLDGKRPIKEVRIPILL